MVDRERETEDWMIERFPILRQCKRVPPELLAMGKDVATMIDLPRNGVKNITLVAIERTIEFHLWAYRIWWAKGVQGFEDGPQ